MTQYKNSDKLALNIVPISLSKEKITIGRMPEQNKEAYRKLQEDHWITHAFRFDKRTRQLLNVAISPGAEPLGEVDEVEVQRHLLLIAKAVQQSILVWLANKVPILRSNKRLIFWGKSANALLLSQAIKRLKLKSIKGLEVVLRYDIDCRMFRYGDEILYLGLIIDLSTSNIIDIPVSQLREQGFNVSDRYVCQRRTFNNQGYLRPKLELIGQVSSINGNILQLTDTEEINEIDANDAFIEPRLENFNEIIKLYYGHKATAILSTLEKIRKPINTANEKLKRIKETVSKFQKHPIIIAGSAKVSFDELLTPESGINFSETIDTQRPVLLFGPQGRNHNLYPDKGVTDYGPYMYMQHERNTPLLAVICESCYRGRVEQFVKQLCDGFPDEIWQSEYKSNPFPTGLIGKFRLSRIQIEFQECSDSTPEAYQKAIEKLLGRLSDSPDLAIVQIKKAFLNLYGDTNPYFVSKAAFMMAGIPTQSVKIENIEISGGNLAYILNNIALAIYAKLDGVPWVMSTRMPTTHELVIGLGACEVGYKRFGTKTRYVGITTVFQGDGRYLVWGLTREVEFKNYAEALLESLRSTVRYVQEQNAWESGDKVRVICHVYKRLRDCEVQAIKSLVNELVSDKFDVRFAFLDISWWHPYHIFDPSQKGNKYWNYQNRAHAYRGEGIPERGLCFQLDNYRGLLHLTGFKEIKTDMQGIPKPLLIELHPDSDFTDMPYLLRQVYHFTFMSWRSFFPGGEPVTITYSRIIAKLLGNLNTVSGWRSQVLSIGNLRNRRWFL